ncbi:MAG: YggT family protein [Alphaproteobacteria bacterium]|nr:YggT family protein [Alphaproteobacteria bacterium]
MQAVVYSLVDVLLAAIAIYRWVVIAAIIMSWLVQFNIVNRHNQIVATVSEILYRVTEPVLRPIRRFVPNLGGIDISPIVLFLILLFVELLLIRLVYRVGI